MTDAANDAVITGATVTLVLRDLNTTTGKTGYYQFKSLESGSEDVRFEHPDYQPLEVNDVVITEGQTLRLDVQLNRTR